MVSPHVGRSHHGWVPNEPRNHGPLRRLDRLRLGNRRDRARHQATSWVSVRLCERGRRQSLEQATPAAPARSPGVRPSPSRRICGHWPCRPRASTDQRLHCHRGGQPRSLMDIPLRNDNVKKNEADPERTEFLVRVDWEWTVPAGQGISAKHSFSRRVTVAELRDPVTAHKLCALAGIPFAETKQTRAVRHCEASAGCTHMTL